MMRGNYVRVCVRVKGSTLLCSTFIPLKRILFFCEGRDFSGYRVHEDCISENCSTRDNTKSELNLNQRYSHNILNSY